MSAGVGERHRGVDEKHVASPTIRNDPVLVRILRRREPIDDGRLLILQPKHSALIKLDECRILINIIARVTGLRQSGPGEEVSFEGPDEKMGGITRGDLGG